METCTHGKDIQDYCKKCAEHIEGVERMPLYIIQEVNQGIPCCPHVFFNEKQADRFYIKFVNEIHGKKFKTVKQVVVFLEEEGNIDDTVISYWTITEEG